MTAPTRALSLVNYLNAAAFCLPPDSGAPAACLWPDWWQSHSLLGFMEGLVDTFAFARDAAQAYVSEHLSPEAKNYFEAGVGLIHQGIEPVHEEVEAYLLTQAWFTQNRDDFSPTFRQRLENMAFDIDETILTSERASFSHRQYAELLKEGTFKTYCVFFGGVQGFFLAVKEQTGKPPILYTQQTDEYLLELVRTSDFLSRLYFDKPRENVSLDDIQSSPRLITLNDNIRARDAMLSFGDLRDAQEARVKRFLLSHHDPKDVPPKFAALARHIGGHDEPKLLFENHEGTARLVHAVEGIPVIHPRIEPDDNFSSTTKRALQRLSQEPSVTGRDYLGALDQLRHSPDEAPFIALEPGPGVGGRPRLSIHHGIAVARRLWEANRESRELGRSKEADLATMLLGFAVRNNEITAHGFDSMARRGGRAALQVKLKTDLALFQGRHDPLKSDVLVRFLARREGEGQPWPVGEALAGRDGVARLDAVFERSGDYQISYEILGLDQPLEIEHHGYLRVVEGIKPALALTWKALGDMDGASLAALRASFDPVILAPELDESRMEDLRAMTASRGLKEVPILTGDAGYHGLQLYNRVVKRDAEGRLTETLKRLLADGGVPLLAGIGLDNGDMAAFERAGLEAHLAANAGKALDKQAEYARRAEDFSRRFNAKDPEDVFQSRLDWLTGSLMSSGELTLHIDRTEAFARLLSEISAAESSIDIEMYQFQPDEVGSALLEALIAKAKEGKSVRLILDERGSRLPDHDYGWLPVAFKPKMKRYLDALAAAGGEVRVHYGRKLSEAVIADHRKITLIDGRKAFISGRNFTEHYYDVPGGEVTGVHDFTSVAQGPLVGDYASAFEDMWGRLGGSARASAPVPALPGIQIPEALPLEGARVITQTPGEDTNIENAFLELLRNKNSKEFTFETDFVLSERVAQALIDESLRSREEDPAHPKRIRLIVGTRGALSETFKQAIWQDLLLAGVEIYALDEPTHAKISTDGRHVLVGSWNPDGQSYRDYEISTLLWGAQAVAGIRREFFEKDLARATRITLENQDEPGFWERVFNASFTDWL